MSTSELDSRNISISMRKSVENLVISSQDAIGQSISQAITFSGVITQHATHIIQDARNVSRSPSPSLRGGDMPSDAAVDFEKLGELAMAVPGLGEGGELPARAESARSVSGRGEAGGARSKKKSWYTALYPTYKSKSDDFKRLFKDLPEDERLIVDYSCALQKDILVHGRLYASQRFLCFHASIFGWETSLSLRWKDVTAITKEKTALVIPNAILVCTEGEKNFLTSFAGRDKAYLMLFRIWQNALMDQPMSSNDIWQWVHSCYGEELGFNSEDEGYARDIALAIPLDNTEDAVDSSSVEAGGGSGGGGGGGTGEARGDSRERHHNHNRDNSPPLMNGESDVGAGGGETLPTDLSDSSDSEPDKPLTRGLGSAACSSAHGGKLLLRQEFPFNIDQLFTMIFTNSKFNLELLAARGASDYVQAGWQPQNGRECRQVSYTLALTSGPIGPKEVQVTEVQVMNKCSKPGWLYSIDASSVNAGIPYADYFTVEAHYCLQRVTDHSTDFSFYGQVKYKKQMFSVVKTFLEKNTLSGLEDYMRIMAARLTAEADSAVPQRKTRRQRRTAAYPVLAGAAPASCPARRASVSLPRAAPPAPPPPSPRALLLLVAALLCLNAILYWRLSSLTQGPTVLDTEDLHARLSSARWSGEWSRVLQQHAVRRRGELLRWGEALTTTIHHLAQTEKELRHLVEMIKPTLDQAEKDAENQDATDHGGNPDSTDQAESQRDTDSPDDTSESTTSGHTEISEEDTITRKEVHVEL